MTIRRPISVSRARLSLLLAGSVALSAAGARADVIYVDRAATGAGTGASWTDAYTDLQAALGVALAGDEIWVAGGVYRPGPAGVPRDTAFHLRSGVALYGGFAGGEGSRELRDWQANPTVLSGDLAGDDGPDFANTLENCYQVVVAVDVDALGVLDGFVVTGGHADGPGFGASPDSRDQGSGINIYFEGPRIANCLVRGNWSLNHGSVNDHGHSSTVTNCRFEDNYSAGFGAGLYLHHDAAATVTGCTFRRNTAAHEGGGMYTRSMHGAVVSACEYSENSAALGAGVYVAMDGTTRFSECSFHDNTAVTGGGGLYADQASPTIELCSFSSNRAGLGAEGGSGGVGGSGGGGIWTDGGAPVIEECTFSDNHASFGGGTYHIHGSLASLEGCVYTGNAAQEAGGAYSLVSNITVTDCVFINNTATGGVFSVGGGMSNYISHTTVRGCLFIGNRAGLGGGGFYSEDESPLLEGCVFHGNRAAEPDTEQGLGGGMLSGFFTTPTVVNCVFTANAANFGGGVYALFRAAPRLVNCTLIANDALGDADGGGAVYGNQANGAVVANCIVWQNSPGQIGGAPVEVHHSVVQGGHEGPGNLNIPPRLARVPSPGDDGTWGTDDDDLGDLRPLAGSPCIDAGDNSALPLGMDVDAGGGARLVDDPGSPDIGAGSPPVVDAGAFEFQGVSCRADFDQSGGLDSNDFFAYLGAFFSVPLSPEADFNRDGRIDSGDFFDFLGAWFAGC